MSNLLFIWKKILRTRLFALLVHSDEKNIVCVSPDGSDKWKFIEKINYKTVRCHNEEGAI